MIDSNKGACRGSLGKSPFLILELWHSKIFPNSEKAILLFFGSYNTESTIQGDFDSGFTYISSSRVSQ